jgi:hypothetical protein
MKTLIITILLLNVNLPVFAQDTATAASYGEDTSNARYTESRIHRPKFHAYPKLPAGSSALKDFIPVGWNVLDKVSKDLNGDKIPDLSMVLQYKDTVSELMPGNGEWENTPRILVLLFKEKENNGYRLALQNNHIIPRAGTGKQGGDPFEGLQVKNNVLTIGGDMGGEYSFRYINGDFYLVSAWTNGTKPTENQNSFDVSHNYDTFYYYKIDFLKSKATILKGLMDGGETQPREKTVSISKRPLLKLKNLTEFDEKKIFKGFIK